MGYELETQSTVEKCLTPGPTALEFLLHLRKGLKSKATRFIMLHSKACRGDKFKVELPAKQPIRLTKISNDMHWLNRNLVNTKFFI